MEFAAELARLPIDPALAETITQLLCERLSMTQGELDRRTAELERRSTDLHAATTKIQAMALEIAHLRRMRFGVKSEALGSETRELFEETKPATSPPSKHVWPSNRRNSTRLPRVRARRPPSRHVPGPDVSASPIIWSASSTAMSPSPAPVPTAASS